MNIGSTIKSFRTLNSMDQKQLAEKLHVSNKTISSWESNRTQPKMEMIEEMCKVFNCRKSDFLSENADSNSIILSKKERELILKYRDADDSLKDSIDRLLAYSMLITKHMSQKANLKGDTTNESENK